MKMDLQFQKQRTQEHLQVVFLVCYVLDFVDNVIKLDYNSLYPSIILTWGITDETDLMNAMLKMLEYVLTTREKYKGDKKKAGKIVDMYEDEFIAKGY